MGARARTLDERLGEPAPGTGSAMNATAVLASPPDPLALWRRAFARGDQEALARRLGWDGLTEEGVRRALGSIAPLPPGRVPSWVPDLTNALNDFGLDEEELAGRRTPPELATVPAAAPVCFADLWLPLVRWARQRLADLAPAWGELLQPEARSDLEGHLLKRLGELSAPCVYPEYERFRADLTGSPAPPADPVRRETQDLYRGFVRTMLEGEMVRFLVEHCVLARHLWLLASTWVETSAELLRRLAEDLPAIESTFAHGRPCGPVARVRPGLSDPHRGGRQVAAVAFASGLELVYKPRPVDLEAGFARFLAWLGSAGLGVAPVPVATLVRPGYGWSEVVHQLPAESREEVRGYYRRTGALLCLTWLLGGSDLHMDNLVAGPSGPHLVDLETLLQPRARRGGGEAGPVTAMERAAERIRSSFLSTGLLTFLQLDPNGRAYDISGLCGRGGHLVATAGRSFLHVNRDGMHLVSAPVFAAPEKNLLLRDGQVETPDTYPDELAEGFAQTYRFLLERRRQLLDPRGPLGHLAGAHTRLVLRTSDRYAVLLAVLARPAYQRDGLVRSLLVDALNSESRSAVTRPDVWPLAADERADLERLDIPYFSLAVDSTDLIARNGEVVRDHVDRSGLDCARDRVRSLSGDHLALQLDLLRSSLVPTERAGATPGLVETAADDGRPVDSATEPLPAVLLEQAAEALADEIAERAIRGDDGSATWIAPAFIRREDRPDHGVSYYLGSGACGIALFLAAASRLRSRPDLAELARAACQPIARVLDSPERELLLRNEGLGALNGLGGVVYALTLVGELLGDATLADLTCLVAEQITPERIATDTRLDVEGGAAGAVFGLLLLYRRSGQAGVLERAAACGRHLVSRQVPVAHHGAGWPGSDGLTLAGFAHGAAGISCALAALHRSTGEPAPLIAARLGFRSERALYCAEERNWPALRRGPEGTVERIPMTAWCHGAPGLALARAASLDLLGDEELRGELEVALETTLTAGVGGLDHLCCGTLGRVDVVFTSGRILGRDELARSAAGHAATVLRRAAERGRFAVGRSEAGTRGFEPGFFHGLSGVGYQLLRLAHPLTLPSVLAFQGLPGESLW